MRKKVILLLLIISVFGAIFFAYGFVNKALIAEPKISKDLLREARENGSIAVTVIINIDKEDKKYFPHFYNSLNQKEQKDISIPDIPEEITLKVTEIQTKIINNLGAENIVNQEKLEKEWPFIVLTVSPYGLERLISDPLVRKIDRR